MDLKETETNNMPISETESNNEQVPIEGAPNKSDEQTTEEELNKSITPEEENLSQPIEIFDGHTKDADELNSSSETEARLGHEASETNLPSLANESELLLEHDNIFNDKTNETTDFLETDATQPEVSTQDSSALPSLSSTPKQQGRKKAKSAATPTKPNTSNNLCDSSQNSKRRKKDPAAPKAPLNGYLIYFNEERADMRMKNPSMGFGELTKIIALKWKDLSTDEKQKFINQADLDKERYVKEMGEYKKSDSYKNYVKEASQAKMARNEEALGTPASHHNHNQHSSMNGSAANHLDFSNETNIAGFDIPIFTEEFIEHSKARETEMRQIRKEINELEQQNSVLHKHIEIIKQSTSKIDTDIDKYHTANNQIMKKLDVFRQTLINCNMPLPNTQEYPTPHNIDDYIMKLNMLMGSQSEQESPALMQIKSSLSKMNFNSLFE